MGSGDSRWDVYEVQPGSIYPVSGPTTTPPVEASSVSAFPSTAELLERIEELEVAQLLLEDQVRQLHRVKTVMDLLAGVAHDLSNALTGIVWCSEAVQRRLLDTDLGAGLADFVGAAEYARKLARRLVSIGRQRDGHFEACRFQDVVADAISLVEALTPRTARLQIRLALPDGWVWGNAEQLQQVIVNLATNAFDALGLNGGSVAIELEDAPGPQGADRRDWLRLRVQDTGHGMSPDTLRRAFEPFFTTKGAHDGNGLGLVVVSTIVERHGGRLRASSAPSEGTCIDVLLPRIDAPDAQGA